MFALNFQSPNHEELLLARKKDCTIRLGDIKDTYPENSIVWITVGKKNQPKRKLYTAIVDKVYVKKFWQLNPDDLKHQNPDISTPEELLTFFEKIYEKSLTMDDFVTVIYFSEIMDE
jgi:hypothetical protein